MLNRGAIQFGFAREWCRAFDNLKVLSFKMVEENLIESLMESFGRSAADLVPFKDKLLRVRIQLALIRITIIGLMD